MLLVPIQPIANQTFQAQLGGQACVLSVYQLAYGLFMDVRVGNSLVVAGVICENKNRIVRSLYLGFAGDFIFVDTQGSADPIYTGLGSRFILVYLEASDLPAGEG
jgi:hypothetical protein